MAQVGLEDRPQDRRLEGRAELREQRRDQRLLPADDRGRAVGALLERDRAAAREQAFVADRVARRRLDVVIVTGSVTEMPRIRTVASALVPSPTGRATNRIACISRIHSTWRGTSATTAQVRSKGASMTSSIRIGSGGFAPRRAASRRSAREGGERQRDEERGEGDEPSRHRGQRTRAVWRWTPAASRSPRAYSPSPGWRSTAAQPVVRTVAWKPSSSRRAPWPSRSSRWPGRAPRRRSRRSPAAARRARWGSVAPVAGSRIVKPE